MINRFPILNIEVDNWGFDDFLEQLQEGVVVTPNVDHLVKLQRDREFFECYRRAEHVVCDSRVILLLSRLLYGRRGIREQIAGSDLLPAFCKYHRNNTDRMRVFLLGGTRASVVAAQGEMNRQAGVEIVVGGYSPPFGFEHNYPENEKILKLIADSGATVLAVGVGAPKQEKWIFAHRDRLPSIKVFLAVGATIDFQAGLLKRAPRWMTRCGLEWLYRMQQEPRRMVRRYLVDDVPFFGMFFRQRMGAYRNPWSAEINEA